MDSVPKWPPQEPYVEYSRHSGQPVHYQNASGLYVPFDGVSQGPVRHLNQLPDMGRSSGQIKFHDGRYRWLEDLGTKVRVVSQSQDYTSLSQRRNNSPTIGVGHHPYREMQLLPSLIPRRHFSPLHYINSPKERILEHPGRSCGSESTSPRTAYRAVSPMCFQQRPSRHVFPPSSGLHEDCAYEMEEHVSTGESTTSCNEFTTDFDSDSEFTFDCLFNRPETDEDPPGTACCPPLKGHRELRKSTISYSSKHISYKETVYKVLRSYYQGGSSARESTTASLVVQPFDQASRVRNPPSILQWTYVLSFASF